MDSTTRKSIGTGFIIAIIIVCVLISNVIGTYNSFAKEKENILRMESDIAVMQQRRYELLPNLMETAKGYAKHEEAIFAEISNARAALGEAMATGNNEAIDNANNDLTKSMLNLNAKLISLTEDNPELKSDTLFMQLMDNIEGSTNRVNIARLNYNNSVGEYNGKLSQFPTNMIAGMLGFEKLSLLKVPEEQTQNPTISFE